jgi:hypothetical protein
LPLYTAKTFPTAPDGIYAWLETDRGFYASPVRNELEFGSRHIQTADRVQASKVFLGGELEKTGTTVKYNLLSGSFMRDIETLYPGHDYKTDTERLFVTLGLTPVFTDKTVIVAPVTLADVRYYKSQGYKLWLFDTHNACLSADWALDPKRKPAIEKEIQKALAKVDEYEANGAKALEEYKKAIEQLAELQAKPTNIPADANNNARKRLELEAFRLRASAESKRDSAARSMWIWNESIKNVMETIKTYFR